MRNISILEKIYNWMGHPWVPMGRFFSKAHGLGWAASEEKTMGGLGQDPENPWVDLPRPSPAHSDLCIASHVTTAL
jgi:hypothetical protein